MSVGVSLDVLLQPSTEDGIRPPPGTASDLEGELFERIGLHHRERGLAALREPDCGHTLGAPPLAVTSAASANASQIRRRQT